MFVSKSISIMIIREINIRLKRIIYTKLITATELFGNEVF